MSWSASVPATPKDEFEAAVDAAEVGGQDINDPAVSEVVTAAKATAKNLAATYVTRPKVSASLGGHVLTETEGGPTFYEGITVSVSGSE
jgi:hypothetical protein